MQLGDTRLGHTRAPRRSRAASGSRSSKGRPRASRVREARAIASAIWSRSSPWSTTACGSGAPWSGSVSSSDIWSPPESPPDVPQLVERDRASNWRSAAAPRGTRRCVISSSLRHLLVGWSSLQACLELLTGALDVPGLRSDRPRHPVEGSQLVDDRAADPRDRVGLELDLPAQVEALDRRHQPRQPVRDQIGLLDMPRQPGRHPPGDVLHERRICDYQPLPGALVSGELVPAPKLLQLDRFDVRFQFGPGIQLPSRRAGGRASMPFSSEQTLPECRPGSWRSWRGRAAPGSIEGPRLPRADASRTSAAAHGDAPGRAPGPAPGPAEPRSAAAGGRRRSAAAGQTWRETAALMRSWTRSGSRGLQRWPSALQVARQRRRSVLSDRNESRPPTLPFDADAFAIEVDRVRRPRSRAPRPAIPRSKRARKSPGRAIPAASSPGSCRAAPRPRPASAPVGASAGAWGRLSGRLDCPRVRQVSIWTRSSALVAASLRATLVAASPRSERLAI